MRDLPKPIETMADIAAGLDALCDLDPRLVAVREKSGAVALRRTEPGFRSLVSSVVSQQVSKASAAAIFGRLCDLAAPLSAETILGADDRLFRKVGLSRPKQKTIVAIARAVCDDKVDLHALCETGHDEAIRALTAIHGIGPWTAQIYLMFAAGHPDIFPGRDIALQTAVGDAFGFPERPDAAEVERIAESWTPWRSVAARLFWAYYAVIRSRDAVPL